MKVLLLGVGLLSLTFARPAQAQANLNRVAVVRAYEIGGSHNLVIDYGDNHQETTKLEDFIGHKDQMLNAKQLRDMVEGFYSSGYHLESMATGGMQNGIVTTFVFIKDK